MQRGQRCEGMFDRQFNVAKLEKSRQPLACIAMAKDLVRSSASEEEESSSFLVFQSIRRNSVLEMGWVALANSFCRDTAQTGWFVLIAFDTPTTDGQQWRTHITRWNTDTHRDLGDTMISGWLDKLV